MIPQWVRNLAITTARVFFISLVFPVVAGLSYNTASFPKWWGVLDAALAFPLAVLAFPTLGLAQGKVIKQAEGETYRAYRILIHGIFAMLTEIGSAHLSRSNSSSRPWDL